MHKLFKASQSFQNISSREFFTLWAMYNLPCLASKGSLGEKCVTLKKEEMKQLQISANEDEMRLAKSFI